jgi:hypothetical protein
MKLAIRSAADAEAALARLRPVERRATDGASVADMAEGAALLDLIEGERIVGSVALHIHGDTATIRAACSTGQHTYRHLAMLEAALKRTGVRRVGIFTRRRGLLANLCAAGYALREAELIKEL